MEGWLTFKTPLFDKEAFYLLILSRKLREKKNKTICEDSCTQHHAQFGQALPSKRSKVGRGDCACGAMMPSPRALGLFLRVCVPWGERERIIKLFCRSLNQTPDNFGSSLSVCACVPFADHERVSKVLESKRKKRKKVSDRGEWESFFVRERERRIDFPIG